MPDLYATIALYNRAHIRVRNAKGNATEYNCVECGRPANEWAYDHKDPSELVSYIGPYSDDVDHYQPRCYKCHRNYDKPYRRKRT